MILQTFYKQRGLSFGGWLLVIALIIFFALLAIRIGPIYMENATVKSMMRSLKDDPDIAKASAADVKKLLSRRFEVNRVNSVGPEDFQIKKDASTLSIAITYEVRKPMIGNLDIIVSFNEGLELQFR